MQKKIVLIWPFRPRKDEELVTPLWAFSLGAYLRKKIPDIKISVLDEQVVSSVTILRNIDKFKPDIVGISLLHDYYENALNFARKAKLKGAQVIFGGAYATAQRKEILKNRGPYSDDYCVDAIIRGDGEKALYEYIIERPLNKINNLVYQTKEGIKENPLELLDLSKLPSPDRSFVDLNKYFGGNKFTGVRRPRPISTYYQKGCWWREKSGGCIFCSYTESILRSRDPKVFAKELKELILKYNVDRIRIYGEEFFSDIQWVRDFTKAYHPYIDNLRIRKKQVPFLTVSTRADKITVNNIKILKSINAKNIFIGFESGDQQCLNALRKGISLKTTKNAADLLNKHQIGILGSFILGSPGETKRTWRKTLNLIKELSLLDYTFWIRLQTFTPLPGSLSWQMLLRKTGTKYEGKDLVDWNEVRKDWINYFCNLTLKDVIEAEKEFRHLAKVYNKVKFNLIEGIK